MKTYFRRWLQPPALGALVLAAYGMILPIVLLHAEARPPAEIFSSGKIIGAKRIFCRVGASKTSPGILLRRRRWLPWKKAFSTRLRRWKEERRGGKLRAFRRSLQRACLRINPPSLTPTVTPTPLWTPPSPGSWTPPIGIPQPSFGINETYRMYDAEAARNPSLAYHEDTQGGFYSHYVDNAAPSCWDQTGKPGRACPSCFDNAGTSSEPRCSVPAEVPEGSVVLIDGGTSDKPYESSWYKLMGRGTAEKPVFFRGRRSASPPVFKASSLRAGGQYVVYENLDLSASGIRTFSDYGDNHHLSFRGLEIHGGQGGARVSISECHDIVVFGNHIHDNGSLQTDTDTTTVGVGLGSYTSNVWVVDNHIHHNDTDAFHAGHADVELHHFYAGRNVMHHDRENAIDIKAVRDVVISQNKMFGYRDRCSSSGEALRVNDEGAQDNIWILYNEIYDSDVCIAPYQADFRPYIVGNLMHDCGIGVNDNSTTVGSSVVNNTLHAMDTALIKVKYAANNLISNAAAAISSGQAHHNLIDPHGETTSFENAPLSCSRLRHFQLSTQAAILRKGEMGTTLQIPGLNLEAAGVRPGDRVELTLIPEIQWKSGICANGCLDGGTSTKPICAWQWAEKVTGDTLQLHRDIACPGVSEVANVRLKIWYYPFSAARNKVYLNGGSVFEAGDHLEYNYDGVTRQVSAVAKRAFADRDGNFKDEVTFQPPLDMDVMTDASICNWRSKSDFRRDFRPLLGSPAVDGGSSSEDVYDAFESIWQLGIRVDITGSPRPSGSAWDVGAFERGEGDF